MEGNSWPDRPFCLNFSWKFTVRIDSFTCLLWLSHIFTLVSEKGQVQIEFILAFDPSIGSPQPYETNCTLFQHSCGLKIFFFETQKIWYFKILKIWRSFSKSWKSWEAGCSSMILVYARSNRLGILGLDWNFLTFVSWSTAILSQRVGAQCLTLMHGSPVT